MEPVRLDSHGWTCQACHRRIPARIRTCRCGAVQPGASITQHAAADGPAPAPPRALGFPLLLVGLVLGLGLALLPARSGGIFATATSPRATTSTPGAPDAPDAPRSPDATHPVAAEPRQPDTNAPRAEVAAPAVSPAANDDPLSLEDLVSRVVPAVASVTSGKSRGTGFFISTDQVLTNDHVVDGQTSVHLQVGDLSYTARVVSTSPATDLAVLKVLNPNAAQAVLPLGTAGGARVGQEVIAIGSALGVLSNTVTRGIVSGVRQVGTVTLVQTDAAINPGNSGGPLIDRTGLVIGVNSLRVAQRAEGVAFAVAIDHASRLLKGQTSAGSTTPLRSLTSMLSDPATGDLQRTTGERELARVLAWAERNGDELDAYWTRHAHFCLAEQPAVGDRPWFATYQAGGVRLGSAASPGCADWAENVRHNATRIRAEIDKARETARRSGVYPGIVRDLFERHRLRWAGWER
jgi:S1-C subfamily serine protease